ncbi:MAG TPA: hypothetical protein VH393_17355 [Ktedonobacterales bacterium]
MQAGRQEEIPGMWPYGRDILGDGEGSPRVRAISVALAAQIWNWADVSAFRAKHLDGGLLAADQVYKWIKTRPECERPPVWYLNNIPIDRLVAVADGSYLIPAALIAEARRNSAGGAPSANTRLLFFSTPQYKHASEPIHESGGVLDTLRQLAQDMAQDYDGLWEEWQAVTSILTGYAPLVPADAFPLPVRSGRRQTDKHLQLAAFTADQDALQTAPVNRLAAWNERFPQWTYKNTTNFGWDSRQALRRLLQQDEAEPVAEREYTAEEISIAHAEKRQQMGGRKAAVWGGEISKLLDDAKARDAGE